MIKSINLLWISLLWCALSIVSYAQVKNTPENSIKAKDVFESLQGEWILETVTLKEPMAGDIQLNGFPLKITVQYLDNSIGIVTIQDRHQSDTHASSYRFNRNQREGTTTSRTITKKKILDKLPVRLSHFGNDMPGSDPQIFTMSVHITHSILPNGLEQLVIHESILYDYISYDPDDSRKILMHHLSTWWTEEYTLTVVPMKHEEKEGITFGHQYHMFTYKPSANKIVNSIKEYFSSNTSNKHGSSFDELVSSTRNHLLFVKYQYQFNNALEDLQVPAKYGYYFQPTPSEEKTSSIER